MTTFAPLDFNCTKCGECCTGLGNEFTVFFFESDVVKAARFLNLSEAEFEEKYLAVASNEDVAVRSNSLHVLRKLKTQFATCPFLDTNKLCTIHVAKPTQCERGPFGFFFDGSLRYDCMSSLNSAGWSSDKLDVGLLKLFSL